MEKILKLKVHIPETDSSCLQCNSKNARYVKLKTPKEKHKGYLCSDCLKKVLEHLM